MLTDLLHRASQIADAAYLNVKDSDAPTPRQLVTLRFIAAHDKCSQTDVVNNTGIDRSTLADIVRRLVKFGLVSRRRDKDDIRAYQLTLTAAGEKALKDAERVREKAENDLLKALQAPASKGLLRGLSDLIATAEARQGQREAA